MDKVDAFGLVGLVLLAAGVWGLAGWAWTALLVGGSFLGVYFVREIRAIVRG